MNKTEAAHYLAAMIDGEGTVAHTGMCRHVAIANTDPDIIAAIERCCRTLGITYRIQPHKKAQEHHRQRWDVIVSNQFSMQVILNEVPLQTTRKVERLKKVLASYRNPPPSIETLKQMYLIEGKGITRIGAELGYQPSSIRYWLRKSGVEMRSHSESAKLRWSHGVAQGKYQKAS